MADKPTENEIVIERVFDAPRELVWRCFTEAEHVARWWGPRGFTTRVDKLDCRVGGESWYVMIGPDGTEYPVGGTFKEVVAPERFVTTDEFGDESQGQGLKGIELTAEFHDLGGRTRLVMTITHPDLPSRKQHEEMGVVGGWHSSFDCLTEHLVRCGEAPNEIALARLIDAPRELVFDAWTDVRHVSNWWGPVGFTTSTHDADFRAGGAWRFTMHGPDGVDYPNEIRFDEVRYPERIVYRHAGGEGHEDVRFESRVTFDERDGKTLVTLRMAFADADSRDETEAKYGAVEGGVQTLGRLAEHIDGSSDKLLLTVASPTTVRLTRLLDASPEAVFEAQSKAEHFRRWWGPRAFEMTECEIDFRVGGAWRAVQRTPDGSLHPFRGEYREITPSERLVYTFVYDTPPFDEHASVETIELVPHGGKTLLVNTIEYDSQASRDGHLDSGMEGGAVETMDRLAELLAAGL